MIQKLLFFQLGRHWKTYLIENTIPERVVLLTERVHHSRKKLQWWLCHKRYMVLYTQSTQFWFTRAYFPLCCLQDLILFCSLPSVPYRTTQFPTSRKVGTFLPSLALHTFSISFPKMCIFLSSSCTFSSSLIQILPHPHKRNLPFCQDIQPCKNLEVMKRRREPKLRKTHLFSSFWKEKYIPWEAIWMSQALHPNIHLINYTCALSYWK